MDHEKTLGPIKTVLGLKASESALPHTDSLYEAIESLESESGVSFPYEEQAEEYLFSLLERYDPTEFLKPEFADGYLRALAKAALDFFADSEEVKP